MEDNNLPKSFVLVVFKDYNSVEIENMNTEKVSPLQLIALAQFLEIMGKNMLVQKLNEEIVRHEQMNLATPKPQIFVPGGK